MTLIGKFFLQDSGEFFKTGEVISAIGEKYVLVQYDNMRNRRAPNFGRTLILVDDIAKDRVADEDNRPSWSIFDTRKELVAYLTWLEAPVDSDIDEDEDDLGRQAH